MLGLDPLSPVPLLMHPGGVAILWFRLFLKHSDKLDSWMILLSQATLTVLQATWIIDDSDGSFTQLKQAVLTARQATWIDC